MLGRPDEGAHGVEAEAGFLGHLEIGRAEIVAVVKILDLRHAEFLGRLADRVEDRPGQALLLDAQFAVLAVERAIEGVMVLRSTKQRQDVVPTPADIAELAPAVIVGGLTAHIDHAVDGGAAAHHLPARIGEAAAVEAHFGLGGIAPIRARIAHAVEIADRDMDPVITIGAAGFEKQHGVLRIGAQAIGEDAARRAGADDDVAVSAEMSAFVGGCSLHRRPFRRGGAILSVSSERDIRAKPMPSTLRHSRPPCRESSLDTARKPIQNKIHPLFQSVEPPHWMPGTEPGHDERDEGQRLISACRALDRGRSTQPTCPVHWGRHSALNLRFAA